MPTAVETVEVLRAEDLVRTYQVGSVLRRSHVSAVDGVSLSLHRGEVLGVVGESGCGKSTLARMLVGLERPDAGRLLYRDTDVTAGHREDRKRLRDGVQMIFQDPYASLDPRMTVLDIVAEPLAANGSGTRSSRRDKVAELLSLVGLAPDMMARYAHQFSGGQRQRIGIARALALDPDVLICDEPVSALDVSVQAQVVNLLADLRKRLGVAIVFIAHDLSVVRHLADRVAVMYLGRIAEIGDTASIYDNPANPYTQALLSAVPSPDRGARGGVSRRRVLTGEPPSPIDPPSGCRFNPRCWLAQDRCHTEVPDLRVVGSTSRRAACHFAESALSGS
ncbi:dipeptide/oligopeptide/nickel ABC transporter ATP-binding protein [Actinophytocola xinjiangensis]|uniref:Dipeptide/oligopeptide/nickel ABC transporter ATP-binding protein n=1 Tax=Actinophytocola xinjiangensis TaxID=485602 RepID=A0A7Z1AXG5_9PSEU|nr:dipeptide ABC transporter ATP-binding protein [Actinophytocola xinjiangensis]OLF09150.1 dipeptide/oligopeptide/nickel ABC transporter ATP-binding protein [Actinophytocola xinjiangensis]